MSVNKVILLGNLGKDPEIKTFENGKKKASFTMATSESYKNQQGEKVDSTEWHNVVFWGGAVDVIEKYLKKGNQVYIEGKINNRSYDDKDGVKKYITEINGSTLTLLGKPATANEVTTNANEGDDLPF